MTELIATDAKEQLRRWDAGETIWSIDMGGMGPGYEQAIQVLAVEIIRDNLLAELPTDDIYSQWGDATVTRCDPYDEATGRYTGLGGLSGAQVGAAKTIAYRILRDGPAKMLESAPEDRRIQVSKMWPRVPDAQRAATPVQHETEERS
jgi:hypothetical protein